MGRMGGTSMGGQCPFEGAFFNQGKLPNQPMASHATARAVKFAFRAELGWYAIAYYPQDRPKTGMKEYGRFTVASVDRDRHLYVITLFDPDYKGAYKARVPNPPRPNDLNGKKKAATIELQVHGQQLLATVKDANSDRVSFSPGDTFQMASREEFMAGALVNDDTAHSRFQSQAPKTTNAFQIMKGNGFGWCLTWVLTTRNTDLAHRPPEQWKNLPAWKPEYWGCLEYATETLRGARAAGLRLHVLLALSNEPTHPGKQHVPPEWRGFSDAELGAALEEHCQKTAAHFAAQGLNVELFTIGNEIEFGILKTTPEHPDWSPPGIDLWSDLEFSQTKVWPREAFLLQAAIRGIKRVNPRAKIVLHPDSVGRSRENRHLRAFLSFMVAQGVDFDYASFTDPQLDAVLVEGTRPYFKSVQFQSLVEYVAGLGKKVIVGEFCYPHSPEMAAGKPDPGYPFTPEGQARWVRDFLQTASNNQAIAGAFYWYPEYYPGSTTQPALPFNSTGLFEDADHAQPALAEFRRFLPNPAPPEKPKPLPLHRP